MTSPGGRYYDSSEVVAVSDLVLMLILAAYLLLFVITKKWEFAAYAFIVTALVDLSAVAGIFALPPAGLFLKLFAVAFFASTFRVLLFLFESWTAKREAKRQERREEECREWKSGCDDYAVLDLPPGASLAEVKAAYRRLAKKCHPDAGGDPEAFMRIHAAYQNLVAGR